jgi:hypothetical protein
MVSQQTEALELALDRAVPSILSPGWVMIPDKDFDAIKQALAAQPAPVQEPVFELQESGWEIICDLDWIQTLPFGTKLYTTPPAQPAPMPDALTDKDGEHPEYIQGWNDCRHAMRGNT